jgi:uncharacterized membrane protein
VEDFDVTVSHDGEHWKVYYYPVDFFKDELPVFGRFLELDRSIAETFAKTTGTHRDHMAHPSWQQKEHGTSS